jgi:hypothetical protein
VLAFTGTRPLYPRFLYCQAAKLLPSKLAALDDRRTIVQHGAFMELYERNTCSFIVKVWVEDSDKETKQFFWRGHITHVITGRRQYFEDITTMGNFVTHYLKEMGATVNQ